MLKLPAEDGAYVYILRCCDQTLYTGWTINLKHRWEAHQSGKGAKYNKAHPPLACVYFELCEDRHAAMKREYEIKQLTRQEKETLIQAAKEYQKITMK